MLHPSYSDLMEAVNSGVEPGEQPVVQSRYSIVIAAAKRARMIIDGDEPMVSGPASKKPLSAAVEELYEQKVKIVNDEPEEPETEEPESDEAEESETEEPESDESEESESDGPEMPEAQEPDRETGE